MKNIVSFSGGKDSTAMLLMMLERHIPIDEIIFIDTGKEFPQMYEHINKVQKYINMKITILKSTKTFDYYMFDHVLTRGKHKGLRGYGWANMRVRWCTSYMKQNVFKKYLKGINYVSYIGIAYDEHKRHEKEQRQNVIHPLYDWKITEKEALQYCYSKGFDWGGLYEHFDRVSCWCCPLKNLKELEALYRYYPVLWKQLKDMDKRSRTHFRKDYSVEELENKFENNRRI